MKVSVCIPTYKRPQLFLVALNSCLNQTKLPDEILVGDDSPDREIELIIEEMSGRIPVKVSYFYHGPTTTHNENVTILFDKVQTELLILLHDDDSLLPNAIEDLCACFSRHPEIDVAFGKQYIITNHGVLKTKASENLNDYYFRTKEYEGRKLSSIEAAFLQQFPNDCYIIRSKVAKTVSYKSEAGNACDVDFGLRLALNNCKFYFLNKYTANFRISADAMSTNNTSNGSINAYGLIEKLEIPKQSTRLKSFWMKRKAPFAIVNAARQKNFKRAFEIYFGKWHRSSIPTFQGIKLFLIIFYHYFLKLKNNK